ncbi:hypothetical protein STHU_11680 [Allostella humosa]|nr:hypothetical protein STHU_11680 [Stella humosa]
MAGLLVPLASLPAAAQMFEVKLTWTSEAGTKAIAGWAVRETGQNHGPVDVPAGQKVERIVHWQPARDVPVQNHDLAVTLPGNRGCRATLELKMTYGAAGATVGNPFSCAIVSQSYDRVTCGFSAVGSWTNSYPISGACDVTIGFAAY